ncbi:carboxy terminal-processing peptidase [Deminuibacter soli]|uniref:Tail-specific protease n=1 Tax=Deminuibacter soli TaxID=2291815 RepID=A0A3E1NGV3_9BACT|nr:carboxy terminal-processing peptidase [Deminuibacter soli]RFM27112.1 tail-specific protease [Deminuibacter soli]
MMSRKVLPLLLIALLGVTFWAFSRGGDESTLAKQQKLLATVGIILEQKHYSPKTIDDNFSKEIFRKYLGDLDPDKNLFLASDIDSLKKYELTIDDEIHGAPIAFFPAVAAIYTKRVDEAMAIYKSVLVQPFTFTDNETVQLEGDSLSYPADLNARREQWRKRLKYLTLENYSDQLDQREKSKATDSIHNKKDDQLEADARAKVLKMMDRNFNRMKARYKEEDLFSLFVNTITGDMDPHTNYFPPVEKRAFDEEMSNRFYGIGAQLREEDGTVKVVSLVAGSPAWKSGQVQVNDVITKVAQGQGDFTDITGLGVEDAVKLIRGNKGTEVRLTLKKADGTVKVVSLVRDEIVQDEAFARSAIVANGNRKIGYIYLPEFYVDFEKQNGAHCAADIAMEVLKLKAEKVDGIILDLRNNGGGSLYEVVQMVGLFVKNGPVVQVKDRDGLPQVLSDNDSNMIYDGPFAVMVNELSASASEIFAAAIQDYKRGIIVGSTSTFGKGTVQKSLPLGKPIDMFSGRTEYGALKLTFEKFYRINGGSTQLKGVTPDVVLPDSYEYWKLREKDNPAALKWDQIPQSAFTPWEGGLDLDAVKQVAVKRVDTSSSFKTIRQNTAWLNKNVDKEYSLNLVQYRDEQKKLRAVVKESEAALKLKKEMNVTALAADKDRYFNNPDKAKGERYQQWLKNLRTDIYIDATAKILGDVAAKEHTLSAKK